MPRYEEHPSKTGSYRNGEFVVLPDADAADATVWFHTTVDGQDIWEGLLARRTARDRARICAVPFWLFDVNLGDEVSVVDSEEGAPVANGLVRDAGNFGFRVVFGDADPDDERWRELMVALEHRDCWFDVRTPGYIALSSPPEHAEEVADFLFARQRNGELQYETVRSRPPGA